MFESVFVNFYKIDGLNIILAYIFIDPTFPCIVNWENKDDKENSNLRKLSVILKQFQVPQT